MNVNRNAPLFATTRRTTAEGDDTVELIDKLRNLLSMAAADGSLTEREILFLSHRAEAWGVADHDFAAAVEFALAHPGEVTLPGDRQAGLELLRDMIQMMAADGRMTESEKRMFATAAAYLNVSQEEIDGMIDRLLDADRSASSAESPKKRGGDRR